MSLSKWKELAQSKAKVGKAKNQLYNQITAEKIKSKTSDAAITKAFRPKTKNQRKRYLEYVR